jgi:hypothetical protein
MNREKMDMKLMQWLVDVLTNNKVKDKPFRIDMGLVEEASGMMKARIINNVRVLEIKDKFLATKFGEGLILVMDETKEQIEFWDSVSCFRCDQWV